MTIIRLQKMLLSFLIIVIISYGALASEKFEEYLGQIEKVSGHELPTKSRLVKYYNSNNFVPISEEEFTIHDTEFKSKRKDLIRKWEKNTGKTWPRYDKEVKYLLGKDNLITKKPTQKYEAHHVIPQDYQGPNKWWNLVPLDIGQYTLIHGNKIKKFRGSATKKAKTKSVSLSTAYFCELFPESKENQKPESKNHPKKEKISLKAYRPSSSSSSSSSSVSSSRSSSSSSSVSSSSNEFEDEFDGFHKMKLVEKTDVLREDICSRCGQVHENPSTRKGMCNQCGKVHKNPKDICSRCGGVHGGEVHKDQEEKDHKRKSAKRVNKDQREKSGFPIKPSLRYDDSLGYYFEKEALTTPTMSMSFLPGEENNEVCSRCGQFHEDPSKGVCSRCGQVHENPRTEQRKEKQKSNKKEQRKEKELR